MTTVLVPEMFPSRSSILSQDSCWILSMLCLLWCLISNLRQKGSNSPAELSIICQQATLHEINQSYYITAKMKISIVSVGWLHLFAIMTTKQVHTYSLWWMPITGLLNSRVHKNMVGSIFLKEQIILLYKERAYAINMSSFTKCSGTSTFHKKLAF